MTATPAWGFPWESHLTIAESDMVERELARLGKREFLARLHTKSIWGVGGRMRTTADILDYIQRNPRKPKDAA